MWHVNLACLAYLPDMCQDMWHMPHFLYTNRPGPDRQGVQCGICHTCPAPHGQWGGALPYLCGICHTSHTGPARLGSMCGICHTSQTWCGRIGLGVWHMPTWRTLPGRRPHGWGARAWGCVWHMPHMACVQGPIMWHMPHSRVYAAYTTICPFLE